jgi:hypothetical protein
MSADVIIGVIGLVVGVSGWAAFFLQVQQNRNSNKSDLQNTLESLDQLAGRWMDKIAGIVNGNESYGMTAARINYFNDDQGGYETQMRHCLYHLPEDHQFDDIRQGFKDFRENAFDVKDGLIGVLADEAHPPLSESEWEGRKNSGISGLRAECRKLQELLLQHMKDTWHKRPQAHD